LILGAIAVTPISQWWFQVVSGLPDHLARLGRSALMVSLLLPGLTALQSWYQGALVNARRTRIVTEGIALNLAILAVLFPAAVALLGRPSSSAGSLPGLHVAWGGFSVASAIQMAWLWWRSRAAMARARQLGATAAVSAGQGG
jgi:hypothetical protein